MQAAFFDLDRTLLLGASGPTFSTELKAGGLLPDRDIPGEALVFRIFDVIGETLPSMLATRQMARAASGWSRQAVVDAGRRAADTLCDAVPTAAKLLIARHREEGRPVVIATTSPHDLVAPLAEALGVDDLVATRYGVGDDGCYDGTIDGHFVWGPGKLAAVRRWARVNGVDVESSWAYSDSIYDTPLLSAVAHPVAVNADARLAVYARLRGWPAIHLDVPPGVPKIAGIEPQMLVQKLVRPEIMPWVRWDIAGTERIPDGPAILVANHRSYFDPLAIGMAITRVGRPVRFLGKKEVFDVPVVGNLVSALGGIRVDRGSGSEDPLESAADALAAGELIAIMPEGTIPRGRAFFDPELRGRWGASKLAKLTRAPVIPIGLWGTEQVWPRNSRTPNVLAITDPPTVRVRVGDPVGLHHRSHDADTRRIMTAISALLPPEAREPHEPTPEELARTFPPGHRVDPEAGANRRPGED